MSGGQSGSVVSAHVRTRSRRSQYPPAAASAVILVVIVTLMVAAHPAPGRRAQGTGALRRHRACTRRRRAGPGPSMLFAAFFTLFVLFLYGPMTVIYILSFQGPSGGLTFPMNGVSLHWFDALFAQQRDRRHRRLVRALDRAGAARRGRAHRGDLGRGRPRLPPPLRRRRPSSSTWRSPA